MGDEKNLAIPKIPLRIFNTETRRKEVFSPLVDSNVKMYTCGPTVYNFAHIGNYRTYIFEDLLRRTLKFFGMQVTQVMNLTDVDDKTIKGAIDQKTTLSEFTQPFKNAFFVDIQSLGIERAEHYPSAVEYIPYMIDFIQKLLDKGYAYKSKDHSIYFSLAKFPSYGKLSHLKLDELKLGASGEMIESDEYDKENVGDFALWKAYDRERDGDVFWNSPFGPGRPGWHLECSTMAMEILGETIDIHMGGVDNIFPHHENEIAQSETCSGKIFARYWVHVEHLLVNHKKMSKSLGNFYTLRDLFQKGYSGMDVRYMLLHTHYRTQLNFTFEGMDAAKVSLQRIKDFVQRMQELAEMKGKRSAASHSILQKALNDFSDALADDVNISVSLAALFEMMKEINVLYDKGELLSGDASEVLYVLRDFNRVLGVLSFEAEEEKPPQELLDRLEKRIQARKDKNWALADQMRDEIQSKGYIIEDTPRGPRLKKN